VVGASENEKPRLVQLFEQAAAVMGLDSGQVLLELRFEDGKLVMWWTHRQRRKPADLGEHNHHVSYFESTTGDADA
jgi:hypothetical protein